MSFSATGQRGSDGFWRIMETTITSKSFVDRNLSWFVLRRDGATTYWPPDIYISRFEKAKFERSPPKATIAILSAHGSKIMEKCEKYHFTRGSIEFLHDLCDFWLLGMLIEVVIEKVQDDILSEVCRMSKSAVDRRLVLQLVFTWCDWCSMKKLPSKQSDQLPDSSFVFSIIQMNQTSTLFHGIIIRNKEWSDVSKSFIVSHSISCAKNDNSESCARRETYIYEIHQSFQMIRWWKKNIFQEYVECRENTHSRGIIGFIPVSPPLYRQKGGETTAMTIRFCEWKYRRHSQL
jgi:hypothetical protein